MISSINLTKKIVDKKLILIIIVFGYIFLFSYLTYVSASAYGIRFEVEDFEDSQPTNTSIGIDGNVIIKNTHWYSADITDIKIKMSIYILTMMLRLNLKQLRKK